MMIRAFQTMKEEVQLARRQYRPNDPKALIGHVLAYEAGAVDKALDDYECRLIEQVNMLYEQALTLSQQSDSTQCRHFARDVLRSFQLPIKKPALGRFPHRPVSIDDPHFLAFSN